MENPPHSDELPTTWRLPVNDDGTIFLPEDLLQAAGWSEGTAIYFHPQSDGSIIISDSHLAPNEEGRISVFRDRVNSENVA